MKIRILALAALLASATWLPAQSANGSKKVTLVANYDLDGAASSATVIHSADAITDDAAFTIDAGTVDQARVLAATLTDGDSSISACVYTVTGTQADGTVITATTDLTGGSGVKTLAPAYNWKTVTAASVGTCTGEGGGDTVSLGTTSTVPPQYFAAWGDMRLEHGPHYFRDPFSWAVKPSRPLVKTASVTTEVVSNTASSSAFAGIDIGDILLFTLRASTTSGSILLDGLTEERVVVTNADDDTITVERAIDLVAGSSPFRYKKLFFGPDAEDGWIPVNAFSKVSFIFLGNVGDDSTTMVQCRVKGADTTPILVDSDAVTAAVAVITTVDLAVTAYDQCRAGIDFDTTDGGGDASAAELEDITIQFTGTYPGL